jgi:hypothetical protein
VPNLTASDTGSSLTWMPLDRREHGQFQNHERRDNPKSGRKK